MKKMILFTVAGLLVAGGLYLNLQRKVELLRSEYAKVQKEKLPLQQATLEVAELSRRYGGETDVVTFTEALYGCARQTGIDDHEVITTLYREEPQARDRRSLKKGKSLVMHRLEVSLSGEFRRIAEYIDQMQHLDTHKRITRLALLPGEKVLKAKITIDLYSLGEPHAR